MKSMKKLTKLFAAVATLACAAALAIPALAWADVKEVGTEDALKKAVAGGADIELTQDITLTGPLTIEADATVTIDLKGYSLSYEGDAPGKAMITNEGVLVINDTSENESGVINYEYTGEADPSHGEGNYTILNRGDMTLRAGTIKNDTEIEQHAFYAIDTREGASLNIEGGKVLNPGYYAIRQVSFNNEKLNEVNISGGYVEGVRAIQVQFPEGEDSTNSPAITLDIAGGELKSLGEELRGYLYKMAVYIYSEHQSVENLKVSVSGGTIYGDLMMSVASLDDLQNGAISVSGGTIRGEYGVYVFTKESEKVERVVSIIGGTFDRYWASDFLIVDANYIAKLNSDNTFTVVKKENLGAGTYMADPRGSLAAYCSASVNKDGTWTVTYNPPVVVPPAPPAASKPIEVPVEGDSTVKVEATVEGTKAEVEEITPEQIESVTSGNAAANVTVDFSGLDQAVTEVSIPASSVEAIAEAAKDTANSVSGLEVKLPEATVQFDAGALSAVTEAIAEETAGSEAPAASDVKVTLVVEAVAVEDLAPAQQEALKKAPNAVVVQATVLVNDKPVHDFKGGLAMVTVPYELPEGANPADVTVWYVSSDGTMEAMQTSYKDGLVTFWAPHFSDYVVTSDEANAAHVCPSAKFSDFKAGAWYHGPVDWAVTNGVLRGDGDGKATLRPTGAVTRAELLTMLHRIEGGPAATSPCTFSDVKAGAWYEGAVSWAQEAGVIKGDENGKGTVRPNSPVTREEMAVILHRYAQLKGFDVSEGQDTNILSFNDFDKLASWSVEAMQWACGAGIVGGYTDAEGNQTGYLGPKDDAQRAQAAAMLQRLDAAYGIL